MLLIRDVLDKQLVDRGQRKMGKVDGLVLEIAPGQPPKLKYIEVGSKTLLRRLGSRLAALARREPYRIPWELVRDIGVDIEVDLDARETPALDFEKRLREGIVKKLPGG